MDGSDADTDISTDMLDQTDRPLICIPDNRTCQNGAVEVCASDGRSFNVEACPTNTFCQQGQCFPITNTCEEGQNFSLLTRDVLFEVRDDLKPSVGSVVLLNCGMSSLFIRNAAIDSPIDENGQDIFSFDRSSPKGLELQPGAVLEMKVQFRPQRKDWAEAGTLFLSIDAGGEIVQRAIELKSQTWCVSTQPRVAMGLVSSAESVTNKALVYNCGTMPLTIAGVNVATSAEFSKSEKITTSFAESLEVIAPGQTKAITFEYQRSAPGPIDAQLSLIIPEQDAAYLPSSQPHQIALEGYVYNGNLPCVDKDISAPLLIDPIYDVGNQGDPLRPMSAHVFDMEQPDPMWVSFLEPVEAPIGTPSLYLLRYELTQFWFLPYWVGQYTFQHTLLHKESGARSCNGDRVTFDVQPDEPLYVELGWRVNGDPIVGDRGAGMDLELHVRTVHPDGPRPRWGWRETDCFVPGNMFWTWPCQNALGFILGASQHGQYPEAFVLEQDEPMRLEFGVYLVNKGFFPSVEPKLRVWRYGTIVQVFEDIDARTMSSPSSFWLVGAYDLTTDVAVPLNYLFGGLPDD